jgi:2-iminobutanoate/2-iminopropanoate deaminase
MKKLLVTAVILFATLSIKAQQNTSSSAPISPFIKVDNILYISGQVGIDRSTSKLVDSSFEAEVKQVMYNIDTQLKANELQMDDLVSTIVYVKDMKNYNTVNEIYRTYFKDRFPTRTFIAVADLPVNANIEISAIASFGKK